VDVYDERGRLKSVPFAKGTPDEGTQRSEYDAAGNRTASIDENLNRTEYRYAAGIFPPRMFNSTALPRAGRPPSDSRRRDPTRRRASPAGGRNQRAIARSHRAL
jgi:YD repeat-containing protein